MMGNKNVSSCNLVSGTTVQELELSLSSADNSWAEAIEMCLAHLENGVPQAAVETLCNPLAGAVSLALTPENLASPTVNSEVTPLATDELADKSRASDDADDSPAVSPEETVLMSAAVDEPEAVTVNDEPDSDATLINEIVDEVASPATLDTMETGSPEPPAEEITLADPLTQEADSDEVMAFSAPPSAVEMAEEAEENDAALVKAAEEVPLVTNEEPEAVELEANEEPEAAGNLPAESSEEVTCAVTEWPKLEDLNLDDFELVEEQEAPPASPVKVKHTATKAIEAFTIPLQGLAQEPSAARALGPAIAELVAARAEIRRLETRYENLEQLHYEASKTLYRRQADFDNYRRRVEREREEFRPQIIGEVVKPLLPVVDNLLRALAMRAEAVKANDNDSQNFVQGVQLIAQQLEAALASIGIQIIPTAGETFNPEVHEAVALETTSDYPPHTVTEEILRGYQLGQHLLRPAMVKVSTLPINSPNSDN